MNEIIKFNFESNDIRTMNIDGEPWFVAKDIADLLGYSNPSKAINGHCKSVKTCPNEMGGQVRHVQIITERDIYRLIMRSRLPAAERFEEWIVSEVLPSIRKTGTYSAYKDQIPKSLPEALIAYAGALQENEALQLQAEQDAPKVAFTDSIKTSKDTILMRELAKLINQSHKIKIGQNKLFCWMRSNGYLIRAKGTDYNMPTQKAMNLGVLVTKEGSRSNGEESHITKTAKVTGKGQVYFINKFKPCTDLVSA